MWRSWTHSSLKCKMLKCVSVGDALYPSLTQRWDGMAPSHLPSMHFLFQCTSINRTETLSFNQHSQIKIHHNNKDGPWTSCALVLAGCKAVPRAVSVLILNTDTDWLSFRLFRITSTTFSPPILTLVLVLVLVLGRLGRLFRSRRWSIIFLWNFFVFSFSSSSFCLCIPTELSHENKDFINIIIHKQTDRRSVVCIVLLYSIL